jgi:vitamin B12 transporter
MAALAATTALSAAPATGQEFLSLGTLVLPSELSTFEAARYGRSGTVITAEEIRTRGLTTVQDALRAVPGVAVNSTGDSFTQVRLRGGEGRHTLVLIDGIEANVSGGGEYIFSGLPLDDVERIEVLRGPQSALYGSNAMAGVISITTRRATEPGLQVGGGIEVGSWNSRAANAFLRFSGERGSLSFSALIRDTDGEDLSRTPGGDTEFNNRSVQSLNGDFKLTDSVTLGFSLRRMDQSFGYDNFVIGAPTPDALVVDAPRSAKRDEFYGKVWLEARALDGRLVNRLSLSGSWYDRADFNAGVQTGSDAGTRRTIALTGTFAIDGTSPETARHTLSYALEDDRETYRASFAGAGLYVRPSRAIALEYRGDFQNGFAVQAGIRHDFNEVFRDATTWSLSGSYTLPGDVVRLRAAAGRAIVNPTMFQQFGFIPGVFVGNPDLRPEDSLGYEIGADLRLGGRGTLGITLFSNDVQNQIQGFGTTSVNVPGTSTRRGVELSLDYKATDWLTLAGAYTYTDAQTAAGVPLVRRPRHELGLRATADLFGGRGTGTIDIRHVAGNFDTEFFGATTFQPVEMPSFTTVNLSVGYDLTDRVQLMGRIVNLTGSDASESWGYYGPGRAFYVGLRTTF